MHLPSEKRVLTKIQLESKGGSMDFLNREHRPITLYYYFVLLLCNITLYYYFVILLCTITLYYYFVIVFRHGPAPLSLQRCCRNKGGRPGSGRDDPDDQVGPWRSTITKYYYKVIVQSNGEHYKVRSGQWPRMTGVLQKTMS